MYVLQTRCSYKRFTMTTCVANFLEKKIAFSVKIILKIAEVWMQNSYILKYPFFLYNYEFDLFFKSSTTSIVSCEKLAANKTAYYVSLFIFSLILLIHENGIKSATSLD